MGIGASRTASLVVATLLLSRPTRGLADGAGPPCIRSPGPDGETIDASLIPGRQVLTKRVTFHVGSNVLVVDHTVLDGEIGRFLAEQGAERFPEERKIRRGLRRALTRSIEVDGDHWLFSQPRLKYHLATVLERGAFDIRTSVAHVEAAYRVSWSLPWAKGRRFFTPTCELLFETLDRMY